MLSFSVLFRFLFWGPFHESSETFRARKDIFSSSVSKNGEVYTSDTSYMKGTSVLIKNMCVKQLCNHQLRDFTMAFFFMPLAMLTMKKDMHSLLFLFMHVVLFL